MRNISSKIAVSVFAIIGCAFLVSSCKSPSYVAPNVKAYHVLNISIPPGMVYVPSGTLLYQSDSADSLAGNQDPVRVSLTPFFMDETEVTNKQYHEFVDWVADSIAITDYMNDPSYFKANNDPMIVRKDIDWSKVKQGEPLYKQASFFTKLEPMFVVENGKRVLNNEKLVYTLRHMQAGGPNAGKYIEEKINVVPDTKVWSSDFPNAQMDFMTVNYYTHQSYENHPVVGVTWKQARSFADWRTKNMNNLYGKSSKSYQLAYNLPTEAQWEYAEIAKRSPEEVNTDEANIVATKGDKLAVNFKQNEGSYGKDGSIYTLPVKSYAPNKFGLFNMAGNVAEWTLDAYSPSYKEFVHDLNPVLQYDASDSDAAIMKRKVVRGGSWKDPAETVSGSVREYEMQDKPHSYIGFRCVMPAPEMMGNQVKTAKRSEKKL